MQTRANDPAFNTVGCDESSLSNGGCYTHTEGLTKREYFAAKAMQGVLADNKFRPVAGQTHDEFAKIVGDTAVSYADALIAALNAKEWPVPTGLYQCVVCKCRTRCQPCPACRVLMRRIAAVHREGLCRDPGERYGDFPPEYYAERERRVQEQIKKHTPYLESLAKKGA